MTKEIDPWFLEVELPDGWFTERDHAHHGWRLVFDGQDRLRCQCMEGHSNYTTVTANWLRRWDYDLQWHPHERDKIGWAILDGGNVVLESPWHKFGRGQMAQVGQGCVREAVAYLNVHHPNWRDLLANW